MVKARTLERRRRSVRNIRKITRTMELISTARFKRAMDRALAASAYTRHLTAVLGHLVAAGAEIKHPLMQSRPEIKHVILLVLTSNRGLCGGFNSAVLRTALGRLRWWQAKAESVRLEVSGKRGISGLKFRGVAISERFTHFDARPRFEDVQALSERYAEEFLSGRVDQVEVIYTKFESASRQYPVVETLLPLTGLEVSEENSGLHRVEYDFLPSPESVIEEIVPTAYKMRLFECFLDSAAAEQIARMVAMKTATENADTMLANLSVAYNRARQTQITSEILEVVSGAEALERQGA